MSMEKIGFGKSAENFNVIIEIPAGTSTKYEVDKESNALVVDRFLKVSMKYPLHYGFIPKTLADDDDPIDILVYCTADLIPGCVISCRPIGVLLMTDEGGEDEKIIAVPTQDITNDYDHITEYTDLPNSLINMVKHFFETYKDLDSDKWVKVDKFASKSVSIEKINTAKQNYSNQ